MRKSFLLILVIIFANVISGCASQKNLVQTVAFDTSCPESSIQVIEKSDSFGSGLYKLQACGKELKYKRSGTVYYAADKSPFSNR